METAATAGGMEMVMAAAAGVMATEIRAATATAVGTADLARMEPVVRIVRPQHQAHARPKIRMARSMSGIRME
ncbi:hypothetical protein D3C87_2050770 [compost metagenome]